MRSRTLISRQWQLISAGISFPPPHLLTSDIFVCKMVRDFGWSICQCCLPLLLSRMNSQCEKISLKHLMMIPRWQSHPNLWNQQSPPLNWKMTQISLAWVWKKLVPRRAARKVKLTPYFHSCSSSHLISTLAAFVCQPSGFSKVFPANQFALNKIPSNFMQCPVWVCNLV